MALTVATWLALALFATLMTYTYLVVSPAERVTLTAGTSLISWSVLALTARDLTQITNSGTEVSVDLVELQWLTAFLALVSALTLLLYQFGEYPPKEDIPA